MLKLHVVLAIDRAGLVGDDGPTHHGVFDVGFLRQIPGMRILAPVSLAEQKDMLRWAVESYNGPVAIRYPRGGETGYTASDWQGSNTVKRHRTGSDVTFLTYGTLLDNVMKAAEILSQQGVEATVLRLMDVSELNAEQILQYASQNKTMIVVEEVCSGSGIRDALCSMLSDQCRVKGIDLGKDFVTHGSAQMLYELCGLAPQSIADYTREVLGR